MSRNIGTGICCDRTDCLVYLDPGSRGKCRDWRVTYQMSCNRALCVDHMNSRAKLEVPDHPKDQPPALYTGETSRSGYRRACQHLTDYRDIRQKTVCPLWRHTRDTHLGIRGPDNGLRVQTPWPAHSWGGPHQGPGGAPVPGQGQMY